MKYILPISAIFVFTSCSNPDVDALSEEDYRRAESFLASQLEGMVTGEITKQTWQPNDLLIYKETLDQGYRYMLANPATGEKQEAFDHETLAMQLGELVNKDLQATNLELEDFQLTSSILSFTFEKVAYQSDLENYKTEVTAIQISANEHPSPDGRKAVYIKDHNLWLRDTKTGAHQQLTFDGKEDYGYGTNNAGWIRGDRPVLLWSKDSKKIATFRHDGRGVKKMYLYDSKVGHSTLQEWTYPLPGDEKVFRIERVVIHLDGSTPRITRLKMPADYHRSTTSDHIATRGGEFLDVDWSKDGSVLSFVSSSRDHKRALLQVAEPLTGAVRPVLEEVSETYYEGGFRRENWRVIDNSNEFIWFSERSNWGHLFLFDLTSGNIKNPITSGKWAVLDVQKVDEVNRQVYFTGSNREKGDPYYHYLYRVNFDGSELTLLTPENAHHTIDWSDSGDYFTDTYSTPTTPSVSVIRNAIGEVVMKLGKAKLDKLLASGWVPPIPFTVKARDGETDLYGLMYTPTNLDESKKYPILNYLYPGPQSGSVGSRSFSAARRDKQAVAELGFIVVEVDAMGTPGRSKSFHDAYYGNMGDNGLPDQIAMIRQLAKRYDFMDIDKVGIWGHSGGGFASTGGILRYPDFYKVAVSSSGNHDNRNYEDDWGEKWHGLLIKNPPPISSEGDSIVHNEVQMALENDNYDRQANQLLARNLKGKLLLAHGMLDDNVPPTNTLIVAEELIKANKEFDMLLLPNARHGYGEHSKYFAKKRWNYFIEHLKGIEPIHDFEFKE